MAQDQAQCHLEGEQEVGGDAQRPGGDPGPHLLPRGVAAGRTWSVTPSATRATTAPMATSVGAPTRMADLRGSRRRSGGVEGARMRTMASPGMV